MDKIFNMGVYRIKKISVLCIALMLAGSVVMAQGAVNEDDLFGDIEASPLLVDTLSSITGGIGKQGAGLGGGAGGIGALGSKIAGTATVDWVINSLTGVSPTRETVKAAGKAVKKAITGNKGPNFTWMGAYWY